MQVPGINQAEIVTDNDYYSEKNIDELLHAHFDFITLIKNSIKWVKKELDSHIDEFRMAGSACLFYINTHDITIMRRQGFSGARKYASTKKGLAGGDKETFQRRIYLNLFFNPLRRFEQYTAFNKYIFEEELSDSAAEKARKYLYIRHYGSKCTVTFNGKTIAAQKR